MKKTYLNTLTPEEIIKRMKNGEVVKCRSDNFIFKMIDGVIVLIDKEDMIINDSMVIDKKDDYYFEEKGQFEITETGVYKTRDGRKAYVYEIEDDPEILYPVMFIADKLEIHVSKNGRYSLLNETVLDIVSKWED